MTYDDKIAHSIICEHTRKLVAHDKSTSPGNPKMGRQAATAESRLKEFNRSRRMLLADALSSKRMVKALPDESNE